MRTSMGNGRRLLFKLLSCVRPGWLQQAREEGDGEIVAAGDAIPASVAVAVGETNTVKVGERVGAGEAVRMAGTGVEISSLDTAPVLVRQADRIRKSDMAGRKTRVSCAHPL